VRGVTSLWILGALLLFFPATFNKKLLLWSIYGLSGYSYREL
jgi:hypothetical protein